MHTGSSARRMLSDEPTEVMLCAGRTVHNLNGSRHPVVGFAWQVQHGRHPLQGERVHAADVSVPHRSLCALRRLFEPRKLLMLTTDNAVTAPSSTLMQIGVLNRPFNPMQIRSISRAAS